MLISGENDTAQAISVPHHLVDERFVGFAFAGAELVAEIDGHGIVTYAAGAFHSIFGRPPDAFIGLSVRALVAPLDHEALDPALALLIERGRLSPLIIRMSDPGQTHLALAGLVLPLSGGPIRICLNFARPPVMLPTALRAGTPHGLARAAEARMRAGITCDLGLFEIVGATEMATMSRAAVGQTLEQMAPNAVATELSTGRYGVLADGSAGVGLLSAAALLENALRTEGVEAAIEARHLPIVTGGLTPIQAARALRHALNVFARDGAGGLAEAGFEDGLAGYIRNAGMRTESLLRLIRERLFNLMFQPIVSLTNRTTHHFEALIRPESIPECAFAEPQDFVMMIEALGLADDLDMAVARLACEAAADTGTPVAFNLSGQSVQSTAFRDRVLKLLRASPARRAGLVIVEMTETAEIEDLPAAASTAEALRSLHVPFCLDDFGAGGADVRLLRALSPDIVKLDGSYVPGVTQGGRERALVAGMVEIARGAGAEIVAERTETEPEADALRLIGVQYGQGWLFGRPGSLPNTRTGYAGGSGNAEWRELKWSAPDIA